MNSTANLPSIPAPEARRGAIEIVVEGFGVAALLGVALAIRLVALDAVPGNVTADEADNIQSGIKIVTGRATGFFDFDWKPAPIFSVWLMTQVMERVGWSVFGMRLTSAVLSVVALVPFYLLARRQVSVLAAMVATGALATNLWYLNFSRSGWENVHGALYAGGAALCVLSALRSGRMVWWIGAGVFCALGLYGYFAGRMIIAAIWAFLPFAILQRRDAWKRTLAGYLLMTAVAASLFAPQAIEIANRWSIFNSRSSAVFVLRGVTSVDEALPILQQQAWLVVRGFLLFDPSVGYNARYNAIGQGMLDPVSQVLFTVGALVSLWRWRDSMLWWSMLLIGIGLVQLLARGAPDGARAVGFAPFLFLMVALGVHTLTHRLPRKLGVAAGSALLVGLMGYGTINYWTWASRPEVLNARRPAVPLNEYGDWLDGQFSAARGGGRAMNVGEWESRGQPAAPTVQPTPAVAPAAAAPVAAVAIQAPPDALPAVGRMLDPIGAEAGFTKPRGVALTRSGSIFVADPEAATITRLSATGAVEARWTIEQRGQEKPEPFDIAEDPSGDIWVIDSIVQLATRFTPDGKVVATVGDKQGLYRPRGIAVDASGTVFIANTGGSTIVRIDAGGRALPTIGGGPTSVINQPTDVAVGADGSIYVAEPAAKRVQKLDPTGAPRAAVAIAETSTLDAAHLAFAAESGLLSVTDPAKGRVLWFDADLKPVGATEGDGPTKLTLPVGIAVSGARVVVADAGAKKVGVAEAARRP